MHKRIYSTLLVLSLTAVPALAQFEGMLEMKITTTGGDRELGGNGKMMTAVGKAGSRSEMNLEMGGMAMKMVILQKTDTPDLVYHINDANKTYTEIDLAKMRKMAEQTADARQYTVQKLGQETILGYKTQHVLVTEKDPGHSKGMTTELWTAKGLLDYTTFARMQPRPGKKGGEEALTKALKDADADGLPLKAINTSPDGTKITMEVVKIDKQSLPASTFQIPAGYTKSTGGLLDMMGGLSGPSTGEAKQQLNQVQQEMQEALKNMPPEQRAMIEKMMKQQAAPNP